MSIEIICSQFILPSIFLLKQKDDNKRKAKYLEININPEEHDVEHLTTDK